MGLSIDPESRWGARLVRMGAWLLRAILATLGRTYRVREVAGGEYVEALLEERQPVLLSFWHNRSFMAAIYFYYHLLRRGFDITVLASQSRDGELVSQLARLWGLRVVRGSASRGGLQALRALHRIVRHQSSSPIMIPDGPHGPVYHFKPGVLALAQTSGAPVLPIGFAASHFLTLGSWDKLIVPWPFARVAVILGEPHPIPKGLSDDALETLRQELQDTIDHLTAEAEAAVGSKDPMR